MNFKQRNRRANNNNKEKYFSCLYNYSDYNKSFFQLKLTPPTTTSKKQHKRRSKHKKCLQITFAN